jgi:hypothetical protein
MIPLLSVALKVTLYVPGFANVWLIVCDDDHRRVTGAVAEVPFVLRIGATLGAGREGRRAACLSGRYRWHGIDDHAIDDVDGPREIDAAAIDAVADGGDDVVRPAVVGVPVMTPVEAFRRQAGGQAGSRVREDVTVRVAAVQSQRSGCAHVGRSRAGICEGRRR